jgi:hypothetical protein
MNGLAGLHGMLKIADEGTKPHSCDGGSEGEQKEKASDAS